jgi:hypothetical protein
VPFALIVEILSLTKGNAVETLLTRLPSTLPRKSRGSAQDEISMGSGIDFHLDQAAALFYPRHEKVPSSS